MSKNRKGIEVDIFVWVDADQDNPAPLCSVSRGRGGVCVNLPLEDAVQRIREELETAAQRVREELLAASLQGVAA